MVAIDRPREKPKLVEFLVRGSATFKKNGNKPATLERFARRWPAESEVRFIVNQDIDGHPCDPRVGKQGKQRRLAFVSFIS